MGMFDKEVQLKNAEFAENGNPFTIYSAEPPFKAKSAEYGENMKAFVLAGPIDGNESDAEKYVVFGVMAEQCGRIESGDLPATVKVGQDGRANVLQKVDG